MIRVWHAPPLTTLGTPLLYPAEYITVADVDTDNPDLAFQLTNHIDRSWWDNDGVTRADGSATPRSTSVGDVLELADGQHLLVVAFGFRAVTPGKHIFFRGLFGDDDAWQPGATKVGPADGIA